MSDGRAANSGPEDFPDWKPTPHPKAFHWCICLKWLVGTPHKCEGKQQT